MQYRKIHLPFVGPRGDRNIKLCEPIDEADWLWHPDVAVDEPAFLHFDCEFESNGEPLQLHVSADQRYELFIDDVRISSGPERSDVEHWSYSSYEINLGPGKHRVTANVWWLGNHAPQALITHRGGFVLRAEGGFDNLLTTGKGPWSVRRHEGWSLERCPPPDCYHDIGDSQTIDAQRWFDLEAPCAPVSVRPPVQVNVTGVDQLGAYRMHPSVLPDMLYRFTQVGGIRAIIEDPGTVPVVNDADLQHANLKTWNAAYGAGGIIEIPEQSNLALLIDLEDYYCGYPCVELNGGKGTKLSWEWAESLYEDGGPEKGHRDAVLNKSFIGFGHKYVADGAARQWMPYWWASGRYVLLRIETNEAPLQLKKLGFYETRYPLEQELKIETSEPLHKNIQGICLRVLQSCAHDSYMDCPYYEQMMYVGDTRLELLTTYAYTSDRRLPKRAIELFDFSRSAFGFVAERYTSRWRQQCNSFALIWTLCVQDYAKWTDDPEWVRERMLGVRSNLDCFLPYRDASGLLRNEPGWTFIDWAQSDTWQDGYSPGYHNGRCCGPLNAFYVLALNAAAELESHYGSKHMAAHYMSLADDTAASLREAFWSEERALLADDLGHEHFSQHMQCLGIIAGIIEEEEREGVVEKLLHDNRLVPCTIYFKFYLMEALYLCGKAQALLDQYRFWGELLDQGLKTCVEMPEPTRSDCHAWGAHPIYHLVSSVAGIRMEGSDTIVIEPCAGDLDHIQLSLPLPEGELMMDLKKTDAWEGQIQLPSGRKAIFKGNKDPLSCEGLTQIM